MEAIPRGTALRAVLIAIPLFVFAWASWPAAEVAGTRPHAQGQTTHVEQSVEKSAVSQLSAEEATNRPEFVGPIAPPELIGPPVFTSDTVSATPESTPVTDEVVVASPAPADELQPRPQVDAEHAPNQSWTAIPWLQFMAIAEDSPIVLTEWCAADGSVEVFRWIDRDADGRLTYEELATAYVRERSALSHLPTKASDRMAPSGNRSGSQWNRDAEHPNGQTSRPNH